MPIDPDDYHPKWSKISRLIRKHRAKNRCEWCQAVNCQPHPVTFSKVVLTVAHLDRDTTNNRFSNLKALCQKCHLAYDKGDNLARRKYGKKYRNKLQLTINLSMINYKKGGNQ